MEGNQLPEVGLAQRVAVKGEEAALELATGKRDPSTGSEWLLLHRVLERQRAVLRAEARFDLIRQVTARDDRAHHSVPR
jgi:hypothetical protein